MTKLSPVQSSSIEAIGYEPSTKALTVQFKNGGVYRYAGVSADQHAKLMGANSVGTHFQQHVRPKFTGAKV